MRVKGGTDGKVEGRGGSSDRHSSTQAVLSVQPSFRSSVDNAMAELELRELLDRLDAAASRLSLFPAERLLIEYRSIVKELLARVVKGFSLKRDLQWRRTTRSTYVTIEKTEAALAELEETFLQESGRTRALQLMEEIKGCLISLLF